MNDAQIWTIIGVLAAALVGMITVTTQLMMRSLSTQIAGVSREVTSSRELLELKVDHVSERLDRVEHRLDRVEGRLDKMEHRFDSLDRDVQVIARRVFPSDES